ncbi:MAG: MmcQ/YjbR family DNA-binding protein [Bacteroidetes bacterium]|nr:MmcQ/YjbR family DNA-binding protein [Bacteroidota bacterium]MDA1223740.1 MmcQ/YjbR family DNA-binding protein [Bacteroidota bacterium]
MKHFEWVQQVCESKAMVTAEFPFNEITIVWKVAGKMFCLGDIESFQSIALKCDPEKALELRSEHPQIKGAFHMSKTHWNDVTLEGLSMPFVESLINHSYEIVVQKLTKKTREIILHQ